MSCHPLVRQLVAEIQKQEYGTIQEISDEAGVARNTIWSWQNRCQPAIDKLEAVYNVIGMTLIAVPIRKAEKVDPDLLMRKPKQQELAMLLRRHYPRYLSAESVMHITAWTECQVRHTLRDLRGRKFNIEVQPGTGRATKTVAFYRLAPYNPPLTESASHGIQSSGRHLAEGSGRNREDGTFAGSGRDLAAGAWAAD